MSLQKESAKLTDEDLAQFDWLNLQKDMDEALPQETKWQKLIRKSSENPFVPIGSAATTAALCYGVYNWRMGRRKMSQYMMRTRVAAQGFTVCALVVGYLMGREKIQKKKM
ncbi:HIG1 domain family member 2A, mitochondrial [Rhynchophorus ferrugineus]|uniref:HIG1 domain-containing protein n=1 Tax=Rhynchophorus ferrugineus TaxID=354439 RepID=A0A834MKI3_RHYFE|nr:hypothetical protein GWI33_001739 [Rhynchophorus ferrugineus]